MEAGSQPGKITLDGSPVISIVIDQQPAIQIDSRSISVIYLGKEAVVTALVKVDGALPADGKIAANLGPR